MRFLWTEDIEAERKRRAEQPEHAAGFGFTDTPDERERFYLRSPKTSRITVRLRPEVRIKLIEFASKKDLKISEICRDLIEWWIGNEEKRGGFL